MPVPVQQPQGGHEPSAWQKSTCLPNIGSQEETEISHSSEVCALAISRES